MRKILTLIALLSFLTVLNSCGIYRKTDAKEFPPQPELRVQKNIEEGRGFRLLKKKNSSGTFEFANSNPLWRASLDTIDFMPLLSVDYGGGLIITDWYNSNQKNNESIKLTIKFLSNEIRADAINVKVFKKICSESQNCKIINSDSKINSELKLAILKKAALYQKNDMKKNSKKYPLKDNN
jgi:hypothetical protein